MLLINIRIRIPVFTYLTQILKIPGDVTSCISNVSDRYLNTNNWSTHLTNYRVEWSVKDKYAVKITLSQLGNSIPFDYRISTLKNVELRIMKFLF